MGTVEGNKPFGQVFEPVRVMAANRLARNGREWTEIASKFNSGTYNNQWMVVDMNKVANGNLEESALWVMEQLPGRSVQICCKTFIQKNCTKVILNPRTWAEDQTLVLRESGYWASYNRAFYPEVFQLSGAAELTKK